MCRIGSPPLCHVHLLGQPKQMPAKTGVEEAVKMEEEKKGPVSKKRIGRFQVTTWVRKKLVPGDEAGFRPEREYESVRACVQYSRYDRRTHEFVRQQIWCNPQELRDLANALEQLGDEEDE